MATKKPLRKPTQQPGADVSEAQIAVHWREEGYFAPSPKFVAQANLTDPKVFKRFGLDKFPECYEDFAELDRAELHLVEALRTLRLMHYAAWIARRWDDPAFPAAFPWFNTQRYWQDRILELREQVAAMEEAPLSA